MLNPRLVGVAIVGLIALTFVFAPAQTYQLGPDSQAHAGIPIGTVEKFRWTSQVFHGTVRDAWIYVPAQYDAKQPACVTIFQDGGGYQDPKGPWRATAVMD